MLNILLDRLHKQQVMHKPFNLFLIFFPRFIAFTRSTTLVKYPPRGFCYRDLEFDVLWRFIAAIGAVNEVLFYIKYTLHCLVHYSSGSK